MILHKRWSGVLLFIGMCTLVFFYCSPTNVSDGPTIQTGNGMVTGILYQSGGKVPAKDAFVFVRKQSALAEMPGTVIKKVTDTVMTDNYGHFSVDSIDTGIYVIEGTDGRNNYAIIDSIIVKYFDSTLVLPPDTLKPAGAIKGVIGLSEGGDPQKVFVLAYGLDRLAMVESDGTFNFNGLAENRYHLRIISTLDDYGVFDTSAIRVISAQTTELDTIVLPFSGIPTVKNIRISYDTLKQSVTLWWDRPDTHFVKSFNVYRRALDPVTTITQLNFIPVVDTLFIDSQCIQNKTYEYRVSVVDSDAVEGKRSQGATIYIALYDVTPENVSMTYDTLKQTIMLRWSNPDTGLVKSYNVYRRNVRLNETFWTPFNNKPITDTTFIDSTFLICPTGEFPCNDSVIPVQPMYEYCVAALVKNIREGVRSTGIPLWISLKYISPTNLNFTYDTMKQTVHLRWNRPDMTILQGFSVFRRSIDQEGTVLSQINNALVSDTFYTDSTAAQNQTYEYRVATIANKSRAQVRSTGVLVKIAASFAMDTIYSNTGDGPEQWNYPNDIAVASNGDIYVIDQGNNRVQVYDSSMHFKRHIGNDVLQYPLKVSVDEQGNIFIVNYDINRDIYSIFIFNSMGTPIDTIDDSTALYDLDARGGLLYGISKGPTVSISSYDGSNKRSWHCGGQDVSWIVAGDANKIFVNTGNVFPDKNKVFVFDSVGNNTSSITLPYYPYAIAFDKLRQLIFIVCFNGMNGSILHVLDRNYTEIARYKIQSDDRNISIELLNSGAVLLALRGEGKIIRLKPLFQINTF
jgi:fibronectin type 3 domain-containing protein